MASEIAAIGVQPSRPAPWRDPRLRGIALQVAFVALIAAIIGFLAYNTTVNLRRQNIATGFGFLDREAAFGIGETLIAYSPADTYARAFLVGLTNTLYVSALGIVLATILGTVMGLARLSSNWLVAKLAQIYVEAFRNIPLPLQLLFWWGLLRGSAPSPREAWQPLPGLFVSNRGILFPVPLGDPAGEVRYQIVLDGGKARVEVGATEPPDISLRLPYDVAVRMTTGALSPQDALQTGALRVSGDVRRLGAVRVFVDVRDRTTYP